MLRLFGSDVWSIWSSGIHGFVRMGLVLNLPLDQKPDNFLETAVNSSQLDRVTKQCAEILHQNSILVTVKPFQAGF
jgi:hypothetical protein